jgi:hypothetical protein
MLADTDSKVIRDYNVLNTEAAGQFKGMARPGYFLSTRQVSFAKSFSKPNIASGCPVTT